MHYNLIDEPWLDAIYLTGARCGLGLAQILTQAHLIYDLDGLTRQERAAIIRALIPMVGRALETHGGLTESTWVETFNQGHFDAAAITAYLEDHRSRFDLFGETPFYQTPGLQLANGQMAIHEATIGKLQNAQRAYADLAPGQTLSLAEGARLLIYTQSYDLGGKHPLTVEAEAISAATATRGADGKMSRARGVAGARTHLGQSWSGFIQIVLARGVSLFHTLMLNLVADMPNGHNGVPAWERPVTTWEPVVRQPREQFDLLTWQTRRLLLVTEDDQVVGMHLAAGDDSLPQGQGLHKNYFNAEPHCHWVLDIKGKPKNPPVYRKGAPIKAVSVHQEFGPLWQGLTPFTRDFEDDLRAHVVRFVQNMIDKGVVTGQFRGWATSGFLFDQGTATKIVGSFADDLDVALDSVRNEAVLTEASKGAVDGLKALQAAERVLETLGAPWLADSL